MTVNNASRFINDEQRAYLYRTTTMARGGGTCQYYDGEGPQCVIGQLGALHGCKVNTFAGGGIWDLFYPTGLARRLFNPDIDALKTYPIELLARLQVTWDGCQYIGGEETARLKMYQIIDEYYQPTRTPTVFKSSAVEVRV